MAIGCSAAKRLAKSSRSSMRATVYFAASRIMPSAPSGSHHSELKRDLGPRAVEDLERLVGVGLRVGLDLLARQRRARDVAAR